MKWEMAVASVRRRWVGMLGAFLALMLGTTIIATSILTLRAASEASRLGLGKAESVAQVTTALSVMVVTFVLVGTFAFVVDQRSRELALLRLIGASPRRIRALIRAEAIVIGGAAALAGCVLGVPGSLLLRSWMVANGIAPAWFDVGFDLVALVIAFFVGVGAAIAGSTAAGLRASRVQPLDALRDAAASSRVMTPVRWILGCLLLCTAATVAVAIAVIEPSNAAKPGAYFEIPLLLAGGMAILSPAMVRPVARAVTWPLLRFGALPTLLRQNTLHGGRRVAAIVTPAVIAVGTVSGMLSMESMSGAGVEQEETQLANIVILGISVTYALMSLANTLMMSATTRRKELVTLGLVGATRRQAVGVLVGEALVAALVGALFGITAAAAEIMLQKATLSRIADPPPLAVPWVSFGQIVVLCAAVASLAALFAAWRVTSRAMPPVSRPART